MFSETWVDPDLIRRMTFQLKAEAASSKMNVVARRLDNALKYNPNWQNQPRVPAGNPDGGQWTTVGGIGESLPLRRPQQLVAGIAGMLEELGGGTPTLRPTPKGATQFIFPNGMILRFDLLPGQYLRGQVPHINLHYNGVNYHINLR